MFVRLSVSRKFHTCKNSLVKVFQESQSSPIDLASPKSVRNAIRFGNWTKSTSGICPGYLQANVVIMKKSRAKYFEEFCRANPQPCPVLAVLPPGETEAVNLATGSNITLDLPKYRIYQNGILTEEVMDIVNLWTNDMVVFLIGCSFSFERHLMTAGVPLRNIEQLKNVSMFTTTRMCVPVGPFSSPLVVSYRPIPVHLVQTAIEVTTKFKCAHGPPVYVGDPGVLGIKDLSKPDFCDPVVAHKTDVPVFWACGVTATLAAISSNEGKSGLVITHSPGHMFVTDICEYTLC